MMYRQYCIYNGNIYSQGVIITNYSGINSIKLSTRNSNIDSDAQEAFTCWASLRRKNGVSNPIQVSIDIVEI